MVSGLLQGIFQVGYIEVVGERVGRISLFYQRTSHGNGTFAMWPRHLPLLGKLCLHRSLVTCSKLYGPGQETLSSSSFIFLAPILQSTFQQPVGKRHSALKGRNLAHFLFSVLATKRSSARFSASKCCLATLLSLCPRVVVSMASSDPRLTFRQMGKSTITAGPKARERTECQHPWFSISSLRMPCDQPLLLLSPNLLWHDGHYLL